LGHPFGNALHVCQHESGGAKNPKPSVCNSVSGVLCETAVWCNNRRWWARVDDMEALGGCSFANAKPGVGFRPKSETERS